MFCDRVQSSRLYIMRVVIIFFTFTHLISCTAPFTDASDSDDYDERECRNINKHAKQCLNGDWIPNYSTFCYKVSNDDTINEDCCMHITEPTTITSGCPNYDNRVCLNNNSTTKYFWNGKDNSYCTVRHVNEIKVVNCESLYPHLCLYKRENFFRRTRNPFTDVEISLLFNERQREMQLTIYTPEGVSSFEDDIKCFTYHEDYDHETYKKIDIEQKFDSRTTTDHDILNYRNLTVFNLDIKDKPNEYWCKVLVKNSGEIITSERQFGFRNNFGNEFVMYLQVTIPGKNPDDHKKQVTKFCKQIDGIECRIFKLLNFDDRVYTSTFLMHITTKYRKPISEEYNELKNKFQSQHSFSVITMTSSEWCLPTQNESISWKLTQIGTVSVSSQLCITSNHMIAFRKCEGNFLYGAYWEEFNDVCLDGLDGIPEQTKFLYNIADKEISYGAVQNTSLLLKYSQNLSVMDVSFVSKILYEASLYCDVKEVSTEFRSILGKIIEADVEILKESQNLLNSTDTIINALDIYLTRYSESKINDCETYVDVKVSSSLVIHITKPFLNNISGLALYGDSNTFLDSTIVDLYTNTSLKDIEVNNLQAATHVPEKLFKSLIRNITEEEKMNLTVITTIFASDSIFNENEENKNMSVGSNVISVIIPGFGTYLQHPLPMLLRQNSSNTSNSCGYWAYGKSIHSRKGKWSRTGINYKENLQNSSVLHCAFSHLTHFVLLIMNDRTDNIFSNESIVTTYGSELTVITIVCSTMSTIGIFGIFLTAIVYKQWRDKPGTKFLLQLSLTIIFEIILVYFADLGEYYQHNSVCVLVGTFLHYVVISKFSWMLVIAFLQYLRFVRVLGAMPTRLLLKSMLIGWVLPLAPVLLTLIIFPYSYGMGHNFCYPKGMAFYIGLLIPSILIIAANISVFILIMRAIQTSKAVKYDKSGKMLQKQVRLAILLFFLLGIHWIFGILAEILPNTWLAVIFMFLFCITTGLQGFVLFTFYVVLDKDTRYLWIKSIKSRF